MTDTWANRILAALRTSTVPLDDDQLAARLGASQRQTINQVCRRLATHGTLRRQTGPDGKIVNVLVGDPPQSLSPESRRRSDSSGGLLAEDDVKAAVKHHLEDEGWVVRVAWGRERGVDIDARRGGERFYLEAKGEAANPPQQVNYFLGALGELVQRLHEPSATYGLALPDSPQYRGLLQRLPTLAWERLHLTALLVDRDDRVTVRAFASPTARHA
jgi:hypothetical protein